MALRRISDINVGGASGRLEVRVLKRWMPYYKQKDRMTELCYLLVDVHGDAIEAVTHVNNAEHFDQIIKVDLCYMIEKYVIQPQRQYMPSVSHPASLKFGKRATFFPSDNQIIPRYYFNFASYEDLAPRLNLPRLLIDYIGRVEHVTPIMLAAGKRLRKVKIQDERHNKIEVTLWGEKADLIHTEDIIGQVFVITAATTTRFNTIQLESSTSSIITLDPSIPELLPLLERLKQLTPLAASRTPTKHITIADLKEKINNKNVQQGQYTCTGRIISMHEHRGWFYANCPKCSQRVCLDGDKYVCLDDDIEEDPTFMYCLNATVKNDTDQIEMVFFNDALNNLLDTSCKDMVLLQGNKDPKTLLTKISSKKGKLILLHIAVKKGEGIAVNQVQDPTTIQPATPDPKKSAKRNMPHASEWNKKQKGLA